MQSDFSDNGALKKKVLLKGEKVALRHPLPEDLDYLRQWWEEPEGNYFDAGDRNYGPSEIVINAIFERISANLLRHWFIIENDTGIPVGYVVYRSLDLHNRSAEIAIRLGQEHWNQGFGADATSCLMTWLFEEFDLERIWLSVLEFNPRAIRMYEKCGFEFTDRFADNDGITWRIMNAYRKK